MKTLILFASKHGCTKSAARQLADKVPNSDLVDVAQQATISLVDYDTVIIGSSIYVGQIDRSLTEYLKQNSETLQQKRIGLFVCCGFADKAIEQLTTAFPAGLVQSAVVKGYFGYDFTHLSFAEKLICRAVKAPVGKSELRIAEIDSFAQTIAQQA